MKRNKIAITTSTFGKENPRPLELLNRKGLEVRENTFGHKLNKKEILELCANCIGIIAGTERYDSEILEKLSALKVISRCGTGIDNIDTAATKRLGIKVFNTPDEPALAVAELTIGLIFGLLRRISFMDRNMRQGSWAKAMGNLLYGKRVGIVGFGRIGRKVAELLKPMNADIFYTDSFVPQKEAPICPRVEFKELLEKSDIITLHIPYSEKNHHLFGKKEFSEMKEGAFLINCSRGGIVDEKALYSALRNGKLSGAAIDVFEEEPYNGPLKELDNAILTPHIGSYAKETRAEMEFQAVKNLIEGLG